MRKLWQYNEEFLIKSRASLKSAYSKSLPDIDPIAEIEDEEEPPELIVSWTTKKPVAKKTTPRRKTTKKQILKG